MPATRSYVDIMATRPSSTALRKPLLSTTPPRTRPNREKGDTAALPASSSAIADSPRRLLSYYLAKAAYNADDGDAEEPTLQGEGHYAQESNARRSERTAVVRTGANNTDRDESSDTPAGTPATTSLLRPPPFSRNIFSKGSRTGPASTRMAQTPPATQQPPPSPFPLRSGDARAVQGRAGESSGSNVNLSSAFPPRPFAAATPAEHTQEDATEDNQESTTSAPPPPSQQKQQLHFTPQPATVVSAASTSRSMAFADEQEQHQFEADIMHQVEVLLQAQRSESYTELEAYRLTAEEAQATLRVVEKALAESTGSTAVAAATHLPSVASPPASFSAAPLRSVDVLPPSPLDVDQLALDLSRAAAAAAPSATQRLLDAIMDIRDGQDVPSVVLAVVRELYDELTRALVPPVMHFVQTQQQRHQAEQQRVQRNPPNYQSSANIDGATSFSVRGEALLQVNAETSALQEEVVALRRALDNRVTSGCVLPSIAGTAGHAESTSLNSRGAVQRALLDRFFNECHAMLTRCRQESLSLRRALEEERRQHFLTRIRLLKPAPPSLPAPVPSSGRDSVSSPVTRSSTASHDRRVASAERVAPPPFSADRGVPQISPAFLAREVETQTSPHRWTPVRSPVQLASDANANEDDEADPVSASPSFEFARARRASSPPLRSALQVAAQVLRSTSKTDAQETPAEHPYYAHDDNVRRGALFDSAETAAQTDETGLERRRPGQRRHDGPSVSFADSALEESHASLKPSLRGQPGDSFSSGHAFSRKGRSAGAQPNDEHEKRVWSKAVELLNRYSVA